LRTTIASPDTPAVKRLAREELRKFDDRAQMAGVSPSVVRAASYALCATLDEAVLSTPWGSESAWAQTSLLTEFHHEAWGGEKFFDMLEGVSRDPARHLELLELQYLCMAVGFAGKYHASDKGLAEIRDVQREAFQSIRQERGTPDAQLSLRWRGVEDRRHRVIRYVPWWVAGAAGLVIVAVTYVVLAAWLRNEAVPVHEALLAVTDLQPTPAVPTAGPTLKQLLAQDESRGDVAIEERGSQTTVTPSGDLFSSGSATVNPRYDGVLQRIAAALNQLRGSVQVTGHTDDQPLRSSVYADNFELSRERAVSVARILQRTLDNPGRVTSNGAGSLRPLPGSTPQNRARNRRVEIHYVAEN
jgi:type VI secretion system protein ImpK